MTTHDPREFIPHRPPFLLVDTITELQPGVSGRGSYAVPHDLAILAGHFPDNPILPGVYQVEAIAQMGAAVVLSDERYAGSLPLFGGIDRARFRRVVRPGDVLELSIEMTSLSARAGKGQGRATVGGDLCADISLFFIIAPAGS
ncbi:3-hydroxyacyl-ACP dehydratase FabZ [Ferrimicrobium acidiphilum]|jgi:3-hydroxyacyl-[acyl-carrier-protein] dehydratase|uniref:3-hydroxyacyl-[acyl-carrier-protein] dehydratase FabZ n=1 Tax=Ferrimicrobium acidiphilum DSM 19497 TaxID=1121877 RepID=A0A0D8FR67_9ACTN|nr:3-hydroxyacyl-ACP dehydratase FabZ [Ferrimicrobium acidiphilum]KJE75768.1 3-hydroxyacyl-[acyl-carrier-protein] dehydratase FabZ [Ferrimicrobium acidiphilum DSM 19497]